jgi:NAD(P)-dependent dehydrogenase (short-subunit alcohol dehydrogenase family)
MAPPAPPLIHLQDKVALVTGASRGIGEAIARAYAAAGARVVLAARKPEELGRVAESIRASGGEAFAKPAHTGKPEDCRALVEAAVERYGRVDVLVNNAAANPYFGPMVDIGWGAWDKTFEVNVKGYFELTRLLVAHLRGRKTAGGPAGGAVVNVASVVGLMGAPLQGVYAMTKAAVISMTKTLALELGGDAIRVNAIAPGLVETKFASALTSSEPLREEILGKLALKRVGQPEDIAGLALYLASDAASYVTGAVFTADAGWTVG